MHKLGRIWKRPDVSGGSRAKEVRVAAFSIFPGGLDWPGKGPVTA